MNMNTSFQSIPILLINKEKRKTNRTKIRRFVFIVLCGILIFCLIFLLLLVERFVLKHDNRISFYKKQNINNLNLKNEKTPLVLLISIDGFRYDYLKRGVTPNLNRLSRLFCFISIFKNFYY